MIWWWKRRESGESRFYFNTKALRLRDTKSTKSQHEVVHHTDRSRRQAVLFAVDLFGLWEADVEGEEGGGVGEMVLTGEGVGEAVEVGGGGVPELWGEERDGGVRGGLEVGEAFAEEGDFEG
jgi:hypothetical protein